MHGLIVLENMAVQPVDTEILALNAVTKEYGVQLSAAEAKELSDTRAKSIRENERLEIGLGAVDGILRRFCRSSYVNSENYAVIVNEITEIFYYIKTETDDKISDNDLLNELYIRFEQRCRGSIDALLGREAEAIIRKVNAGDHYEAWFGARDAVDTSRDAGENVLRDDATGQVTPYLTTEGGEPVYLQVPAETEPTEEEGEDA